MEVSKKMVSFLACLLLTQLILTKHNEALKPIKYTSYISDEEQRKEIIEQGDKLRKTISNFEHKYTNKPRLLCTTCKKETYTPSEELSWVFIYSATFHIAPNKVATAKKLLAEAFEIFPDKELDVLVDFLARAANEIELNCYDQKCTGTQWSIIKYA